MRCYTHFTLFLSKISDLMTHVRETRFARSSLPPSYLLQQTCTYIQTHTFYTHLAYSTPCTPYLSCHSLVDTNSYGTIFSFQRRRCTIEPSLETALGANWSATSQRARRSVPSRARRHADDVVCLLLFFSVTLLACCLCAAVVLLGSSFLKWTVLMLPHS